MRSWWTTPNPGFSGVAYAIALAYCVFLNVLLGPFLILDAIGIVVFLCFTVCILDLRVKGPGRDGGR